MNKGIKKKAADFIKKQKISTVNYEILKNTADNLGYTILEFNSICNDKDIETVVDNLGLQDVILKSRGFTYVSKDYRLIFINENLNDEEKMIVLSHELGHIVCGHFNTSNIIGQDVKEEYEANEFSHVLLHPGGMQKIKGSISNHKKLTVTLIIVICIAILSASVIFAINKSNSYAGNLYITSTGKCYHKKECIFVKNKTNSKKMTKEEFESGAYSPCDMCLPDIN